MYRFTNNLSKVRAKELTMGVKEKYRRSVLFERIAAAENQATLLCGFGNTNAALQQKIEQVGFTAECTQKAAVDIEMDKTLLMLSCL
jgi:hypothetical protein